jgi:hypothetical protein
VHPFDPCRPGQREGVARGAAGLPRRDRAGLLLAPHPEHHRHHLLRRQRRAVRLSIQGLDLDLVCARLLALTHNTIVTTSFDGSVVQCVLQLHTANSWSSSAVSGQFLMSARAAATRECAATAFGDASPCLVVVCIVKRQSSMHTTATSATACPPGGTRSRLSTRTQLRSAAGVAGEQQKSLQRLSMPLLCCIVQAGCYKRCDA